MIFFDTETVGFTGPLVTIQFSYSETDPIVLYNVWENSIYKTLRLIESFCEWPDGICGFNLVFDWFQLTKWYNIFKRVNNPYDSPNINEIYKLEQYGPSSNDLSLKPKAALDLMLLARSNEFQYLAKHKDIIIRKVPVQLANWFECNEFIKLPPGVELQWRVSHSKLQRKDVKDVIGRFGGLSTRLKHLDSIICGSKQTNNFEEAGGIVDYQDVKSYRPWGGNWIKGLNQLIGRFKNNIHLREYAIEDVKKTIRLWKYLGEAKGGDDDSEIACLVGASHWYGFSINIPAIQTLLQQKESETTQAPTYWEDSKAYLEQYLDPTERLILANGTGKAILEELERWENHPVAEAAKKISLSRQSITRVALLKKLLFSGSFHFTAKVQGTLSSRMSGDSGMNMQGIPREKIIRSLFPLCFGNEHLEGGDFDAFEVSIACAIYKDQQLIKDVLSGKKFGGIIGSNIFYPELSYEHIMESKGNGYEDYYTRSKNGFFNWIYGGHELKLSKTINRSVEEARIAIQKLRIRYPEIARHRESLANRVMPLSQPDGPGTKIFWNDKCEREINALTGANRQFTLELSVIRGLYNLCNEVNWKINGTCRRTNREQTIEGAMKSAIFSSIFNLQGHIFRAASNHEIQAVGAQLTKGLQRQIWDLQPTGIHPWKVRPMNVHDEIMCPTTLNSIPLTVNKFIKEKQELIPLLKMEWKTDLKTWGDK